MMYDNMILGEKQIYTTNMDESQINNNVLVVASSGAGKTYSVVQPCLLETNNSNLVLSDPKGVLCRRYGEYFRKKGYKTLEIDLDDLENSKWGYDPITFVNSEFDVISLAHTMIHANVNKINTKVDPYWDNMAEILLISLIMLSLSMKKEETTYLEAVLDYANDIELKPDGYINRLMMHLENQMGNCLAVREWKKIYALANTEKTWSCIKTSLDTALARYESNEFREFLKKPIIDLECLLKEKTVLFLRCSDSDETLYSYANIFYSQLIKFLFQSADKNVNGKLSIPIRIIFDDFASNVVIEDIGRILSTCRSRDLAITLIIQSDAQLKKIYGDDMYTIYSNCDSLVFLGTNDLETARSYSERLDIPLGQVLTLPIDTVYVIRRGNKPIITKRYNIKNHSDYEKVYPEDCKKNNEWRLDRYK